jgi:hypothetical protein
MIKRQFCISCSESAFISLVCTMYKHFINATGQKLGLNLSVYDIFSLSHGDENNEKGKYSTFFW